MNNIVSNPVKKFVDQCEHVRVHLLAINEASLPSHFGCANSPKHGFLLLQKNGCFFICQGPTVFIIGQQLCERGACVCVHMCVCVCLCAILAFVCS